MSQQINLFNPLFMAQKKVFSAVAMARALGVLLLGCGALGLYGQQHSRQLAHETNLGAERLAQKQARLDKVNSAYPPRESDKALIAEAAALEARLALLRQASDSIARGELGNQQGYAGAFRALARQSSEGLWLTGVRIDGAVERISLEGRALDAALVPAYLGRLGREPVLEGKRFDSLRIGQPKEAKEGGAIEFGVSAAAAPAATTIKAPEKEARP